MKSSANDGSVFYSEDFNTAGAATGGIRMAKAGMRRPDPYDAKNHGTENRERMHHPQNEQAKVPEIQGAAKTGNAKAGPINAPNWARDDYKASHVDKS